MRQANNIRVFDVTSGNLPKGQKARSDFPRFGLPQFTDRFPDRPNEKALLISVNGREASMLEFDQLDLPVVTMRSDFHCVTTWSSRDHQWGGVLFREFYENKIQPLLGAEDLIGGCVFTAQDGCRVTLWLEDLLQDNVMLADSLDDKPLTVCHGAPLRLVLPAQYGYKNLKHVSRIDFYETLPVIKRGLSAFLEHPRARVAYEERGRWVPGWILRWLYRPLIAGTVRDFRNALDRQEQTAKR